MTLIKGFRFHGYRSFPTSQPAVLFPLGKMNLIAGQNNTGKSNILRVIADTYSRTSPTQSPWDRPLNDSEHSFARYELHMVDEILTWEKVKDLSAKSLEHIRRFLNDPELSTETPAGKAIWFGVQEKGTVNAAALEQVACKMIDTQLARDLSMTLTGGGSSATGDDAYRVLRWISSSAPTAPSVFTVGGVRAISDESSQDPDLNGLTQPFHEVLADR